MSSLRAIRAFTDQVAREFRPERIVLFGSHAYGDPSVDSDVDILVVMPFRGKPWHAAAEIRGRVRSSFPLDLIVRSPSQIDERLRMGDPFYEEITQRGRILYDARNR